MKYNIKIIYKFNNNFNLFNYNAIPSRIVFANNATLG